MQFLFDKEGNTSSECVPAISVMLIQSKRRFTINVYHNNHENHKVYLATGLVGMASPVLEILLLFKFGQISLSGVKK